MRDVSFDSAVGSILGGALGDGWGGPFEGRHLVAPIAVPDELLVSDDTQLTVATCDAIVEAGGVDPESIAARFLAWFRGGMLRGLGASTLKALFDLQAGAHWALAGARGERAAGNGAAMRAAPLAFVLDPFDDADRVTLRDVCRITHHNEEAYVGALAVVIAVRLASDPDHDAGGLLRDVARSLPDSQVRDRLVRFDGLGDVVPAVVAASWGNSGFVADSVPLALFAARAIGTRPFLAVVGSAVAAGGDTDTIGSLAGQIAGARVGRSALPDDLLARLRDGDAIGAAATRFGRFVERR